MSLDDLKISLEKALSLLNDRQPGLMTWNMFFGDRIQEIYNMLHEAGIRYTGK